MQSKADFSLKYTDTEGDSTELSMIFGDKTLTFSFTAKSGYETDNTNGTIKLSTSQTLTPPDYVKNFTLTYPQYAKMNSLAEGFYRWAEYNNPNEDTIAYHYCEDAKMYICWQDWDVFYSSTLPTASSTIEFSEADLNMYSDYELMNKIDNLKNRLSDWYFENIDYGSGDDYELIYTYVEDAGVYLVFDVNEYDYIITKTKPADSNTTKSLTEAELYGGSGSNEAPEGPVIAGEN